MTKAKEKDNQKSLEYQLKRFQSKNDNDIEPILSSVTVSSLSSSEMIALIQTLIYIFSHLDDESNRGLGLSICSLGLWHRLCSQVQQLFLTKSNRRKRFAKLSPKPMDNLLWQVVDYFINNLHQDNLPVLEHCLVLFQDLMSQLPTRRYFEAVIYDSHLVVYALMSDIDNLLFKQLVEGLVFYVDFPVDTFTGNFMSEEEQQDNNKILSFQKFCFSEFKELIDLALSNTAMISSRDNLAAFLAILSDERLVELCEKMSLNANAPRSVLEEALIRQLEDKPSVQSQLASLSLYPDECSIFDEQLTHSGDWDGDLLPIPRLNLQFLSIQDYLLRNFYLFRLNSILAIRSDIEDSIERLKPTCTLGNRTEFTGWSRMAKVVHEFSIIDVARPIVGQHVPAHVKAQVSLSLSGYTDIVKKEWDAIRQHDVLFLINIQATPQANQKYQGGNFREHYGIVMIRGCEVYELPEEEEEATSDFRRLHVLMDASQYQRDMANGLDSLYSGFNVIVRRKPKENNFKGVLDTARDLMNSDSFNSSWLKDLLLGYGDPMDVHYSKRIGEEFVIDFKDTFIDQDHLRECFGDVSVEGHPPYKVKFAKEISAQGYYGSCMNNVRFTPKQVEAIKSGMLPGLTMIQGPPATGKSDLVVQIVANLYHSYPNERIIVITHSNQALNQLFEKISHLDVQERHLLRLGHGSDELKIDAKFSRMGRLEWFMERRSLMLSRVDEIAKAIGVSGDHGYTCETALYFNSYHVLPLWQRYEQELNTMSLDAAKKTFPFLALYETNPLESLETIEQVRYSATWCFDQLANIFAEIEDIRPFEIFKTSYDKNNYLLMKEARIIAMTSTHAALKRSHFVKIGLGYDTIIYEEAAQISEIETFIPLVLQKTDRLKRVVMVGDHYQLPPIVHHLGVQKFGNMEQGMFTRLVRLGVNVVQLDAQGRCRRSIADLFRWRYKQLYDLPFVKELEINVTGMAKEFQFIDVPPYQGKGETEPIPHYYQNIGEAEYIVALYQYLLLMGHKNISILSMYNGQKELIKDVLKQRVTWCDIDPIVTSVDHYQGRQNDSNVVLLSTVRTKSLGHIKDLRRFTVAMSRARIGLYVFGKWSLFEQDDSLQDFVSRLGKNGTRLEVVKDGVGTVMGLEKLGELVYSMVKEKVNK